MVVTNVQNPSVNCRFVFGNTPFEDCEVAMKRLTLGVLFFFGSSMACAESSFGNGFELGKISEAGSSKDGFFIQTLKASSTDAYVPIGQGGAGEAEDLDTKVVRSETVGGQIVRPRKGTFFLRSSISYDKNYENFVGNSGKNKARSTIAMGNPALQFNYDEEGYLGFSIFVPSNYEHETGVKDSRGNVMLLTTYATTRSTIFEIGQFVNGSGNEASWMLGYSLDATSTEESNTSDTWIKVDLGPVTPDIGKWTDFVIRYRVNPFSKDTNPADLGIPGSMNRIFEGNKGILQVWKSETDIASGQRKMELKANILNKPIGLVPHETNKLLHSFRIYKFGWHNNPTSVEGPIWFGFDEIRQGLALRDGTHFQDVHPDGMGCPIGCDSAPAISVPATPSDFRVD